MTTPRTAALIIASTRAAAGVYQDECAPLIQRWLVGKGYAVQRAEVVPDGPAVQDALEQCLKGKPAVLITSGGTGLSEDDVTPDLTEPFLTRSLPGIMEALRRAGAEKTPMAALSRGHAGVSGRTFIINLPGSPGAVEDGLAVLDPILDHICAQLEGSHEH
ncbi:molybdenum cofactor synthesis domain-containing protein [Arthrobacter subterraneus]|uniref:Molybdenum cofactor synthesis domain-containing protein n=1 Tax=Arthrobacter subterraneus TaxID=335973 RepID=A0A1G8GCQ9_9MICC|nr:MogA/MoaB family molybdenum cofactor biosynthesis protein [Arthrobacter subterraneus]SDH92137.1 molybdenum cofactor synthesis domain-containing protein [Arthrobacter subterraneus]